MYPSTSATSSTHTTYFPFATINIAEAERQSVCTLLATTATAEPSSAPTSTFSTSEIGYALREVGNCEGHVFIESKEECEAAALDLEVLSAGTSVRAGSWSNRPHGCFIRTATCSGEAVTSFCHSVRKVWAADRGEVVFNHDGNVENSDTDRVSICTRTTTASGAKSPVQLFADLYTRNEPIMHCPAPFSDTLSQALHFPGARPTFSSNFIHAQTDVLNAPACVALCIGFVGCKSCTFKASDVLCQLYPKTYAAAAYQTASTTTDLYSLVPCAPGANITANVEVGSFSANVAGPTIHLLRAGDMVKLTMQSAAPSTVGRFLAPQTVHSTWRPLEDITDDEHGIRVEEMHIVAEVVGTRVRFREPIQVSIRAEEGWTLRRVPYLNEVGIEDIGFMGSWTGNNSGTEGFVHHGDAVNDGGWKFIGMQQVLDGWIRRCTFINSASPIIISSSVSVSVYQVTVAGTPGHFPLVISGSYGVFVGLFEDLAGFWHGPAVKSRACSTVFWRCSWQAAEPFDCHGSQPYTTLVDVAKVRSSTRQPGRSNPPPLNSRSGGSA